MESICTAHREYNYETESALSSQLFEHFDLVYEATQTMAKNVLEGLQLWNMFLLMFALCLQREEVSFLSVEWIIPPQPDKGCIFRTKVKIYL